MLLKIEHITVHYGKAIALDDISLEVGEGSIVSIIGANGAGKTTTLRAISGLTPLTSGDIWFMDRKINGMKIHEIVELGVIQIPEGRRLFPYFTVFNNLIIGSILRKDKAGIKKDIDQIFERFPVLRERRDQKAGTLSGGEQQMLAIACGLMAKPKVLLMDEPSVGLSPLMVERVGDIIKAINQGGVSILLVEQNVPLALRVANRGYALNTGKVVLEGDIDKLKSSEILKRAYFGE